MADLSPMSEYHKSVASAKCCAAWLKFDIPEDAIKKGFTRIKDWASTGLDTTRRAEFENDVRKAWAAL